MYQPKGGRGNTAPYDTKQIRIPVPLEPQIQELIARYRNWISGGVVASFPPRLLDMQLIKPVDNLDIPDVKPVDNLNTKPVDNLDSGVGISQLSLAKRLGCSDRYIRRLEQQGYLEQWSKQKDPDKISWELRDKKYYPKSLELQESAL